MNPALLMNFELVFIFLDLSHFRNVLWVIIVVEHPTMLILAPVYNVNVMDIVTSVTKLQDSV